MSLESFPKKKQLRDRFNIPESQRVAEDAFVAIVQTRILEGFADDLAEAGFSEDQEKEFRNTLAQLSSDEVNAVLSIPYELRERRLERLYERIARGQLTVPQMVTILSEDAHTQGSTIAYHVSSHDIRPVKDKKTGATSWSIDGKEKDHRDNDLPMAYYSADLGHLYGSKRARFIYVIRSMTGENSSHRQDNDGAWGRAPKLDIIDQLDYEEVLRETRERVQSVHSKDTDAEQKKVV